jgi:hypothetical protein
MKITIDEKAATATIVVDLLAEPKVSSTGKTILLATASGNGGNHKGKDVKATVSVYHKNPAYKKSA